MKSKKGGLIAQLTRHAKEFKRLEDIARKIVASKLAKKKGNV